MSPEEQQKYDQEQGRKIYEEDMRKLHGDNKDNWKKKK